MERISNDINELRNVAQFEVENFDLDAEEKIIAYFSEFPSIGSFHFKIVLIENKEGKIRSAFRQWDTEYNFKIWQNGIYNLDRLRIVTDEKNLLGSESSHLKNLLAELDPKALPETLHNSSGIILDGCEWRFGINFDQIHADYQWRAATGDIELFVPIIEFMRYQHRAINKRA